MILKSERPARQPSAIISHGFRPFFLAGAVQSALAMLIWLPMFFGDLRIPTAFSPVDWHAHEMLYGYLPAIIAGFLLTAIPNWTGRPPLQGRLLAVLVLVWLAGRLAVLLSEPIGPVLAGCVDAAFLVLLAAASAREVIASRNWKNLPPVGLLSMFVVGNVIFHTEAHRTGSADTGRRIGIATAVLLVALIGGRVIPAFTRNWLVRENPGRLPVPFGRPDAVALGISVLALGLWIVSPEWQATSFLLLCAGIAHAVRLSRWAGDRTLRSPLALILHIAYGFIPAGFVLLAGAGLFPDAVPVSAGIHAWTAGALGVMTLAMMTRVSLGHTGGPLSADGMTCAIYMFVIAAALMRVWAAFEPARMANLLLLAGAAWVTAFGLFAVSYGPKLIRRRISDG
jgi:uncharacterized protein involved in response to NO